MNCGNFTTHLKKFSGNFRRRLVAFTLIELLVVITIIGLLAAMGLPHLKGWGESSGMTAATRQMMDDLSLARQKAISTRSTVYIVFVSPRVVDAFSFSALNAVQQRERANLFSGQYTSYALFTRRSVGDQPGRSNVKYLTPWKSLPDKFFIATNKFIEVTENTRFSSFLDATNRPFATNAFPFPTADSPLLNLPYVAFNSQGQLASEKNQSAKIPLTKGSIFYARDANGALLAQPADLVETPAQNSLTNFNNIWVDSFTGRTHVERREF